MFPPAPSPSSFCSLTALAWFAVLRAQQQPGPPFDPNAVLATLKDLKTKQQAVVNREKVRGVGQHQRRHRRPGQVLRTGGERAVEFQNGTGNDAKPERRWRKRHAADLRNRDFIDALRLHLIYLNLTWQHSMGAKTKDQLLGALLDYVAQVSQNEPKLYEPVRDHPQIARVKACSCRTSRSGLTSTD